MSTERGYEVGRCVYEEYRYETEDVKKRNIEKIPEMQVVEYKE